MGAFEPTPSDEVGAIQAHSSRAYLYRDWMRYPLIVQSPAIFATGMYALRGGD